MFGRTHLFGRPIHQVRSRYGKNLCPGRGFRRLRLRPECRDAQWRHQPLHPLRLTDTPQPATQRRHPPRSENGQAVNSSSSRLITAPGLVVGRSQWSIDKTQRATPSRAHCRRIDGASLVAVNVALLRSGALSAGLLAKNPLQRSAGRSWRALLDLPPSARGCPQLCPTPGRTPAPPLLKLLLSCSSRP